MFGLIDPEGKSILTFDDLSNVAEQMKFNLS